MPYTIYLGACFGSSSLLHYQHLQHSSLVHPSWFCLFVCFDPNVWGTESLWIVGDHYLQSSSPVHILGFCEQGLPIYWALLYDGPCFKNRTDWTTVATLLSSQLLLTNNPLTIRIFLLIVWVAALWWLQFCRHCHPRQSYPSRWMIQGQIWSYHTPCV